MQRLLCCCCLFIATLCSCAQTTAYDRGPNGLEAWTDDHHTNEFRQNTEPFGVVIVRNGKRIRYIGQKDGAPFFWHLMLLADGKRIAYQYGPFHFSSTCVLMAISTGRKLEEVPCFSDEEIAADPDWVRQLLDKDRKPTAAETKSIQARFKR